MKQQDITKDPAYEVGQAVRLVKRVYTALMQNTILRSNLAASSLSETEWRDTESLMERSNEEERGSHDAERLYAGIHAALSFTKVLAKEVKPILEMERVRSRGSKPKENQVMLDMTLSNLDENISLLRIGLRAVLDAARRLESEQLGYPHVLNTSFAELEEDETWQDV